MVIDARKLMIDRRGVSDIVDFRFLSTQIKFDMGLDVNEWYFANIHDWYWCDKHSIGYKKRVHPL